MFVVAVVIHNQYNLRKVLAEFGLEKIVGFSARISFVLHDCRTPHHSLVSQARVRLARLNSL